MYRQI